MTLFWVNVTIVLNTDSKMSVFYDTKEYKYNFRK